MNKQIKIITRIHIKLINVKKKVLKEKGKIN